MHTQSLVLALVASAASLLSPAVHAGPDWALIAQARAAKQAVKAAPPQRLAQVSAAVAAPEAADKACPR